jgi:hypothetical protein
MSPPPKVAGTPMKPAVGQTMTAKVEFQNDDRLPPPGTTLTRDYKKQTYQAK